MCRCLSGRILSPSVIIRNVFAISSGFSILTSQISKMICLMAKQTNRQTKLPSYQEWIRVLFSLYPYHHLLFAPRPTEHHRKVIKHLNTRRWEEWFKILKSRYAHCKVNTLQPRIPVQGRHKIGLFDMPLWRRKFLHLTNSTLTTSDTKKKEYQCLQGMLIGKLSVY